MRHTAPVSAAVLALLFTAACDSPELPAGPQPSDVALNRAAPQGQIHTPDDEYARVSRAEVPGFAGYFLRADGTPVIRLKDGAQRGAAQRYLAREIAATRRGRHANAPSTPVFLPAAYDFAELQGWAEKLTPLLQREGIYLVDVDEVENRVLLGVGSASDAATVRAEAVRLGIPANAVATQVQGKPGNRATVRDRFTTVVGGIQIAFGSYVCTQGFNARRNSNSTNIFVTNAHCTTTQFVADNAAIYQHTVSASNLIGNEVSDRGLYACVTGVLSCRRADAAFISHNGTRTIGQGGIARTAWAQNQAAPLTVTGEYDIVGRYTGTLPVGTYLDKTGRTSGSTYGTVTNSCVTIGNLRCQDISTVWSEGGDSGSPMYVYLGGSGAAENDVQLYGILWGGPVNDLNTTYSSRLAGIEADLGTLSNLCRPGLGC